MKKSDFKPAVLRLKLSLRYILLVAEGLGKYRNITRIEYLLPRNKQI